MGACRSQDMCSWPYAASSWIGSVHAHHMVALLTGREKREQAMQITVIMHSTGAAPPPKTYSTCPEQAQDFNHAQNIALQLGPVHLGGN